MHLRSKGFAEIGTNEHYRPLITLCVACIFIVFAVPSINGAQSNQGPVLVPHKMLHGDFADWPQIRQDVGFIGEKSMPVTGLTKDQMLVIEDGVQQSDIKLQEIRNASSICLLIDQSSSMKKNGRDVIQAARQIIAIANPTDEFAIVAFDKDVHLEQEFTTDSSKLEAGLQRVGFGGSSGFFDAVWVSIDQLEARGPGRRKFLIILSDGDDNYSRVELGDLLRKLRYPGTPLIYSLSPPPENMFDVRQNSQALPNLQALSKATGGISYESDSLGMLKDDAAEISRDIRSRYSLEYTSTHTQRDGKLHKVEMKVKPGASASKVKTYFRQEYYAPSN